MLDNKLVELASRQYGVFSRAQALEAGVGDRLIRRRLDAGWWISVAKGVYGLPGVPDTWHRRVMAVCLEAGPSAVASHETAAALHRFAGFPQGPIVVLVSHGDHQHLRGGELRQVTDLRPHHWCTRLGIPVTTPARTLVDLAARTRPGRLQCAVENALASGTCSLKDVSDCVEELRRRGKRGITLLSGIVVSLGPGPVRPASVLERRFLALVRAAGLPEPAREHELPWASDSPERLDYLFRDEKVIFELDSRRWHTRERDFEADRRRDRAAQLAGYCIYRFTWEDLELRSEEVVATVWRALGVSRVNSGRNPSAIYSGS